MKMRLGRAVVNFVLCFSLMPLTGVAAWADEGGAVAGQARDDEGVRNDEDARGDEVVGDEGEKIADQVRNDDDARNDEGLHNDESDEGALEISPTAAGYSVEYRAHVAKEGWKNWTQDGKSAGTTGKSRSIEALEIKLKGDGLKGSVEYRTHVQAKGWLDYTKDGKTSGTTGKALRTEAINIRLTGEAKEAYDIYYRVHVQGFGWLGWAKNDEPAGSAGYGYRMEAIEIRLIEKGKAAPTSAVDVAFKKAPQALVARSHIQNVGWQGWVADGKTTGTTGRGYRMEALCLQVANADYSGSIEYRAHVSGIGWQGWKSNGIVAGTTGQSRQMEAVQVRLTGELAEIYDVYYRVHSASIGWLGWAKNSEVAGITGFSCRMEAMQVRLVAKGGKAPGSTDNPSVELSYTSQGHVASKGWLSQGSGRRVVGTTGQGRALEAFKLSVLSNISGGIEYNAFVKGTGWQGWKKNGALAGTEGQGKRTEAIRIRLTGDLSNYFDVYYRAHVAGLGWMGWARNGANAGTGKLGRALEAFEIVIVAKSAAAPGSMARAYTEFTTGDAWLDDQLARIVAARGNDLRSCFNYVVGFPYRSGSLYPTGNWAVPFAKDMLQNKSGNCYRFAALFCCLAQQLGYDAKVVSGWVPSASGGRAPHGWVEIRMNGQTYVCDPDLAHEIPGRNWYMFTYGSAPTNYGRW